VSVMQGNLFNCDQQHPAPSNDAYTSQITCGSDQFDDSLIASFAAYALGAGLLAVIVYYCTSNTRDQSLDRPVETMGVGFNANNRELFYDATSNEDMQAVLAGYRAVFARCWRRAILASSTTKILHRSKACKPRDSTGVILSGSTALGQFVAFMHSGLNVVVIAGSSMALVCLCVYPALNVS